MALLTNKVVRSTSYDSQKGVWVERGYFTASPGGSGTITANLGLEVTIDSTISANLGDAIFVNPLNLTAGLVPAGARVTAAGVVKVKLYNVTGSNITDSVATTYDYVLYHYS